jgi:hypothetical protein
MLGNDPPERAKFSSLPSAASKAKTRGVDEKLRHRCPRRKPSNCSEVRPPTSGRAVPCGIEQIERGQRRREPIELGVERPVRVVARQAAIEEKLRRANQVVERESEQATGQKLQTVISVGATLVGALLGRKAINVGTIGRATAARGMSRTMKRSEDIERAKQTAAAVEEQRKQLEAEFAAETAALDAANDVATETLEKITIKPKKTNIVIKLVGLVWAK